MTVQGRDNDDGTPPLAKEQQEPEKRAILLKHQSNQSVHNPLEQHGKEKKRLTWHSNNRKVEKWKNEKAQGEQHKTAKKIRRR